MSRRSEGPPRRAAPDDRVLKTAGALATGMPEVLRWASTADFCASSMAATGRLRGADDSGSRERLSVIRAGNQENANPTRRE